jgi:hypothetical protein
MALLAGWVASSAEAAQLPDGASGQVALVGILLSCPGNLGRACLLLVLLLPTRWAMTQVGIRRARGARVLAACPECSSVLVEDWGLDGWAAFAKAVGGRGRAVPGAARVMLCLVIAGRKEWV